MTLASDVRRKTNKTFLVTTVYYKLQVEDQLKTEELLSSNYLSATAGHLLRTRENKQTNYYSSVYYKLQVQDQLKTGELLLSDLPTYTTFTMHRPFVSTWVLPCMLDKTLVWLC